jgi:hypothetical protein
MHKYKIYIYLGIAIIIAALTTGLIMSSNSASKYKKLYQKELQNVEAYQIDNSGLKGIVRQYKMTIDDLYASQDSLDKKLIATMKELKVKDNKIKDLHYQLTQASRTDTITVTDTIFREDVSIDTTFGDAWYNMHLQLKYPSTIITAPTFNSEQYVYIYNTKVYNTKPSKCFFINWFKKKHTVTEVRVEEKSPYINIIQQKFIEINK